MYKDVFMFLTGFSSACILAFSIWIFWIVIKKLSKIKERGGFTTENLKAGIIVPAKINTIDKVTSYVDNIQNKEFKKAYVLVEKYGPGQPCCTYDALIPIEVFDRIIIGETYNFYVQKNQTLLFNTKDNKKKYTVYLDCKKKEL